MIAAQQMTWQERIANRPRIIGVKRGFQYGADTLRVGQVIQVPASDFHKIRTEHQGATANLTQTPLRAIISANPVPWHRG